jgi:GT2 family glycosyltransferase
LPCERSLMDTFPGDVSVGVVTFNGRMRIGGVIDSILACGCPPQRIGVFDVGSSDDVCDWVAETYPSVRVYPSSVCEGPNPGPNPCRNRAIRLSPTDYILVMDDDVHLKPEAPARLRSVFDRYQNVGVAVPVVLYGHAPDTIQYSSTRRHYIGEAISPLQGRPIAARGDQPRDVQIAGGGAMLIKRSVAEAAGMFDEGYFMGDEDGEFAHRILLVGYRLVEEPTARVLHHGREHGTRLYPFKLRNRWQKMLKLYQWRTLLLVSPMLMLYEVLLLAVLAKNGHAGAYFRGLTGLTKMLPDLPKARREVAHMRRRHDRVAMEAGPLLVPADFLKSPQLRVAKQILDDVLMAYWRAINLPPVRWLWEWGYSKQALVKGKSDDESTASPAMT